MKKTKKILSVFLVVAGLVASLTGCDKNTIIKKGDDGYKKGKDMTGKCGDNLTYEYVAKTGKLIIKGTGEMTSCPWSGYGGVSVKSVEFEEGITSLYHGAFYAQSFLEGDIVLPSTLTYIDDFSFYGTSSLNSVRLAEGTTYLGDYAFRQSGIKGALYLPDSVTYIGDECFDDCKNLTGELKLPSSLKKIGRVAFDGCSGFTGDLIIPDSVETIGDYAFGRCEGFDGKLVLSNNLTEIPEHCFYLDKAFTGNLVIPDSVETIGERAFLSCGFDGTLTLPSHMQEIKDGAFEQCKRLRGKVTVSEGITYINSETFDSCENIEFIELPESLKVIGNKAFYMCKSLSGELKLPEGLIGIGAEAFYGCEKLSGRLNMPQQMLVIGDAAMSGCKGLSGQIVIPENVTAIGAYAFEDCSGFTGELVIPDSVAVIREGAFEKCSGIDKVVIGKNVVSIGKSAFYDCSSCNMAEFANEAWIPDYYAEDGYVSFPEGCDIKVSKDAKNITYRWENVKQQLSNTEKSNEKESGAVNSSKEEPYYWTDSLKQMAFFGAGIAADTQLKIDDTELSLTINDRDATKYAYFADSNSDDYSIQSAKIYYKDGFIQNLQYIRGYRDNIIKGEYVCADGTVTDLYFIASYCYADNDTVFKIELGEDLTDDINE